MFLTVDFDFKGTQKEKRCFFLQGKEIFQVSAITKK
jgi:hypothetical protein